MTREEKEQNDSTPDLQDIATRFSALLNRKLVAGHHNTDNLQRFSEIGEHNRQSTRLTKYPLITLGIYMYA